MEYSPDESVLNAQPRALYARRRERILKELGESGALVLAASPELMVGRDTELRYVVDPELYYLTGYSEPEAVAVFVPSRTDTPFTMFVRPRDSSRELWTGVRGGTEAALSTFGADAAFPIEELPARLPELLSQSDVIHARLGGGRSEVDATLLSALQRGRRNRPRSGRGPHTLTDPGVLLDELRLLKDNHEVDLIRRATALSVNGFRNALRFIRAGAGEWEVEAAVEAGFRFGGADGWAFPTIVAGGANATTLHYVSNSCRLREGELVLLDAGARYRMYCGDITRTFPVSGRFSREQRALYDLVLRAHDAALRLARPGATVNDLHEAAVQELLAGLEALGLVPAMSAADESAESRIKAFYPHKTAHWLGLDVHDVGAYAFRAGARPLAPGMVLTVEPGVYIPADCEAAPPALRGTGIRIEDDILITGSGAEVLSAALPVHADEIEALLAAS